MVCKWYENQVIKVNKRRALFCTKCAATNGFLSPRDPQSEWLFAGGPNPFNFKDTSLISTAFPVRVRTRVTSGSFRPWRRVWAGNLTCAHFDLVLSPATSGVGVRAVDSPPQHLHRGDRTAWNFESTGGVVRACSLAKSESKRGGAERLHRFAP